MVVSILRQFDAALWKTTKRDLIPSLRFSVFDDGLAQRHRFDEEVAIAFVVERNCSTSGIESSPKYSSV